MLINLDPPVCIDPTQYPKRLVFEFNCSDLDGNKPECGLFSGRHNGFEPNEMNQRMPEVPIEGPFHDLKRFEVIAPNRSQEHRLNQYNYVAIGWKHGVYVDHPVATEITLKDCSGNWSVVFGEVELILADYNPKVSVCNETKVVYFVSGHLDLSQEEFLEHYQPRLLAAVAEGAEFVVGDASGTDAMTQEFLAGLDARVTVYHMFEKPRNNQGFPTVGGFKSDRERDEAMTAASTKDIAWVRPGREKSGTAKNLKRRAMRSSISPE